MQILYKRIITENIYLFFVISIFLLIKVVNYSQGTWNSNRLLFLKTLKKKNVKTTFFLDKVTDISDQRNEVHVIYMNFKNAFDSVLPTVTLNTLRKHGLDWRVIEEAEQVFVGL